MQENGFNNIQGQPYCVPQQGPNAVNINIYSPAAYSNSPNTSSSGVTNPVQENFHPLYSYNPTPGGLYYPQNYNNLINYPAGYNNIPDNNHNLNNIPANNQINALPDNINFDDSSTKTNQKQKESEKTKQKKAIIPLTDDYIKTLENYLDNNNSKIRLMGIKEVSNRFKEDKSRKNNPSLIALLNKALQDTSPSVKFLALTALQLEYTKGDEKTIELLKNIIANNKENFGEDAILASDALMKIATPDPVNKSDGGN